MDVSYGCPGCQQVNLITLASEVTEYGCSKCSWKRPVPTEPSERQHPAGCHICGCRDLWRQKDFPQSLGVACAALGAILSTIAWSYYLWYWSIGILMAFALADMLLFQFMPDVLVCYRCGSRYRRFDPTGPTEAFQLDVAERYRQEAKRLAMAQAQAGERTP